MRNAETALAAHENRSWASAHMLGGKRFSRGISTAFSRTSSMSVRSPPNREWRSGQHAAIVELATLEDQRPKPAR